AGARVAGPGQSGGAASAAGALVGATVAVVVEPVAGLGGRRDVANADQRPALALARAGRADAELPRVAGDAAAGIPLVGLGGAVGGAGVAHLGRGGPRRRAADRCRAVAAADLRAGVLAVADAHSADAAKVRELLVGVAVAVVIEAIAGFCDWRVGAYTDERSTLALPGAGGADTELARRTVATAAGIPLV